MSTTYLLVGLLGATLGIVGVVVLGRDVVQRSIPGRRTFTPGRSTIIAFAIVVVGCVLLTIAPTLA